MLCNESTRYFYGTHVKRLASLLRQLVFKDVMSMYEVHLFETSKGLLLTNLINNNTSFHLSRQLPPHTVLSLIPMPPQALAEEVMAW
jgi:hypothetical protein